MPAFWSARRVKGKRRSSDNANRELIFYYADHGRKPAEALRIAELEIAGRQDVYTLDAHAWALHVNKRHADAQRTLDRALAVGIRDPMLPAHAKAIGDELARSRLPVVKQLRDFDFTFQPSLRREQIESLHEPGFVERRENVILLGPPGVGKTHLAISLAIAAAQSGRRVYHGRPELLAARLPSIEHDTGRPLPGVSLVEGSRRAAARRAPLVKSRAIGSIDGSNRCRCCWNPARL